jgi:hypothetical protein
VACPAAGCSGYALLVLARCSGRPRLSASAAAAVASALATAPSSAASAGAPPSDTDADDSEKPPPPTSEGSDVSAQSACPNKGSAASSEDAGAAPASFARSGGDRHFFVRACSACSAAARRAAAAAAPRARPRFSQRARSEAPTPTHTATPLDTPTTSQALRRIHSISSRQRGREKRSSCRCGGWVTFAEKVDGGAPVAAASAAATAAEKSAPAARRRPPPITKASARLKTPAKSSERESTLKVKRMAPLSSSGMRELPA